VCRARCCRCGTTCGPSLAGGHVRDAPPALSCEIRQPASSVSVSPVPSAVGFLRSAFFAAVALMRQLRIGGVRTFRTAQAARIGASSLVCAFGSQGTTE